MKYGRPTSKTCIWCKNTCAFLLGCEMTISSGRPNNSRYFKVVTCRRNISRERQTAVIGDTIWKYACAWWQSQVRLIPLCFPSPFLSKGNAALQLEVTENVIFSPFKFPKPLNSTQGHGSMDTWKERLFSEAVGHLSLCSQCSYHTGVG